MKNINQKDINEINIKILKQIKKQLTKNLSLSELNVAARLALAFQKTTGNEIVDEKRKGEDEILYKDILSMLDDVAAFRQKNEDFEFTD